MAVRTKRVTRRTATDACRPARLCFAPITHLIRKHHDAGIEVTANTDGALVFAPGVSEMGLATERCSLTR